MQQTAVGLTVRAIKVAAIVCGIVCSVALLGCADRYAIQPTLMVGNDRDSHGCIGSAGYQWCAQARACVRPWEYVREQGVELSQAQFDSACQSNQAPPKP